MNERQLRKIVEALKPFAEFADKVSDGMSDSYYPNGRTVKLLDFRKAREAYRIAHLALTAERIIDPAINAIDSLLKEPKR